MVLLGNILLGIAAFAFLLFAFELYSRPIPSGGDTAVGFAFLLIIFHLVFLVCTAAVAGIVGRQGGFAWVGWSGTSRFWFVSAGLLLAVLGSSFVTSREGMALWRFLPLVVPALMIVGLTILLNHRTPLLPAYRLPVLTAVALGTLACLPIFWVTLKMKVENTFGSIRALGQPDSNDLRMIQDIEAYDASKSIGGLLIYTHYAKHKSVREPALAKIRSRPDWQAQLVKGLHARWAPEVFTYLAGNDVNDKSLFAEPIAEGIRMQATLIREKLGEVYQSHHLYAGQFSWEVDRVLLTLKRFEGNGTDYRPMVQELRDAFDAPCKIDKPAFICKKDLDAWLRKH
ncbi:MAG: hypothetical protein IPM98_14330 [Lewinellaceae bacterium]|nr:hypothetical protein [Lewinellaceae bacterium]